MNEAVPPSIENLGRYHRLGEWGPAYEVVRPARPLASEGDWLMKILILETGEELEYRASHIHSDPPADHPAGQQPGRRIIS